MVGDRGNFAEPGDRDALECGTQLTPRFDARGLLPVVTSDAETGEVLMLAYMNAAALQQTIDTGVATYWSRSRKTLWVKGETSGNRQIVRDIRVDCDQDTIWLLVEVEGHGASCHQGFRSCFYRAVDRKREGAGREVEPFALRFIEAERVFEPSDVYGKG